MDIPEHVLLFWSCSIFLLFCRNNMESEDRGLRKNPQNLTAENGMRETQNRSGDAPALLPERIRPSDAEGVLQNPDSLRREPPGTSNSSSGCSVVRTSQEVCG